MSHTPPKQGEPGFSRDRELEQTRGAREAEADLNASRKKAEQEPTIDYAPDPDAPETD